MAAPASRSTVCELRHGKFDYKTNEVVPQSRQKGNNCWFYALKILRNQEETAHPPSEAVKQVRHQFQVLASQRRKQQTKVYDEYTLAMDVVRQFKTDPLYTKFRLWTKEGAQTFLPRLSVLKSTADVQARTEAERTWKLLYPFTQQEHCDDLEAYVLRQHYLSRSTLHEVFLRRLKRDPFNPLNPFTGIPKAQFETLDFKHKTKYLEMQAFQASFEELGYLESTWHPELPVDSLANAIETQGPLYVKGFFGQLVYEARPFRLERTLLGQPVYGWRPGDQRRAKTSVHSIVLIGVSKNIKSPEKSIVYFVDPLDGSNPRDPSQQKIYAMSYQKLITDSASLTNVVYVTKEGRKEGDAYEVGYALYNPALTRSKEEEHK